MWKSDHENVRRENYTLRDALREANNEVRKWRKLVGEMQGGDPKILDKVLGKKTKA